MDYILAAHLAAEQAALSYAVGEWARIWPLQQMIRAMGAYFVRRGSGDELYRRVLERYIAMATESGVTQAVYPEGGLTRDGRMREPKFGVLEYMLRGFTLEGERDLVFVPLGLNYDRVLEDRTQLLAGTPNAKKSALMAAGNTLKFVFAQLGLALRSKWYRFGYACVNFGAPISTKSYCAQRGIDFRKLAKENRIAEVSALGRHLMDHVGRLIPVLPVPLVARVLLAAKDGATLSEMDIKSQVGAQVEQLQARGAHVYVPRSDWDYAVGAGLRMLTLRHLVNESSGLYCANPAETELLSYYARSIEHL